MTREEFEKLVEEEFPNAIPEQFRDKIKNVAFLVEDEVPTKDLLGFYHGIPANY
jgi:predicted Zn-dependent protease with MMP-like domain